MSTLALADLVAIGKASGLDAIGAVRAQPFDVLRPRLEDYAKRGETGFEWQDIEQRIDTKWWFPEAKTYIACAMSYLTADGRKVARTHPQEREHGTVTVYSYGKDYHQVVANRLADVRLRIEEAVGHPVRAKIAVDTSPIVDRFVAEQAGIGWMGKNCMFFTPEHGSFVFLGTLVVDVEIVGNQEVQASRCGTCENCMTACPTGALVAPGVIQATACLSYITQMKGTIPIQYRKAMGRRVWGCDICQWACPENRAVADSPHAEYLPNQELAYPDLIEILSLSSRGFQRMYGHTAAAWRGVRTWQRNALIALGNCKVEDAVPHILPFLSHARPELRISAAWALKQIGTSEAMNAVGAAIEREADEDVRADMAMNLHEQFEVDSRRPT